MASFSIDSLPIPSVERPFGIYLWDHFNLIVSYLSGNKFVPANFQFDEGKLPFSTLKPVIIIISIYYLLVFGGNFIFKKFNIKPFVLNELFQLHNFVLTSLSSTLLLLMVEQLIPIIYQNGIFYAICSPDAWTQELVTLYYLNYLTKYFEFLDTIFLVVKQKKLTFLHTYHHGATALLCYTQLVGQTSISWVPIVLNLAVHVIMYFYYFLAARGIRVWWKEWVTRFQILQFVLDLGFVYFATYQKMAFTFLPDTLPYCSDCAGSMTAAYSGCAILSSYLVLFIAFYIEVYKKKGSRKAKAVKAVRGGFSAKVNEYVNLEGVKLASATPTPSPAPRNRKR
ncbi:hypothetical protein PACTADRAFT_83794 [Pachysolen tannophilus NRRL Y-2460]|uniref:Elongation of fatty acids protein n=1 Tax=Pachysolen tannophilus NRRL Y-2460 TaxID=669874 RepID=A0A1E4U3R4_PACTA|nr:hypothetical protein PACTADRAFT_83794 [Pachysolen tannophilus NRRL Y-2460]